MRKLDTWYIETRSQSAKGFTIIELVIVIAVIGLLAAMVIVNWNASREDARQKQVEAELLAIRGAFDKHKSENGEYPSPPSVPNDYRPNADVIVRYVSGNSGQFCVEANSVKSPSKIFRVSSQNRNITQASC